MIKPLTKLLALFFILLIPFAFIIYFWVVPKGPEYNHPTEYIYRALIPIYPGATNLRYTSMICELQYEVNKYELQKVMNFYNSSFILNSLFKEKYSGLSDPMYDEFGKEYRSEFKINYKQRLNLNNRGLLIQGNVTSSGTFIFVECRQDPLIG